MCRFSSKLQLQADNISITATYIIISDTATEHRTFWQQQSLYGAELLKYTAVFAETMTAF